MEHTINNYLNSCKSIFMKYQKDSKIVSFPGTEDHQSYGFSLLNKAIDQAEQTVEFQSVVVELANNVLSNDLKRLSHKYEEEMKKRKDKKKNLKDESEENKLAERIEDYKQHTSFTAVKSFFRNSGIYLQLWNNEIIEYSEIIKIFDEYQKQDSIHINLIVIDGFSLYDTMSKTRKTIDKVEFPFGELKRFNKNDLVKLILYPQIFVHYPINKQIIDDIKHWYVLKIEEEEPLRSNTFFFGGKPIYLDLEYSILSNIKYIAPLFILFGGDVNIAKEIHIRTNVFDINPVVEKLRNGYLPDNNCDDEGNTYRSCIIKTVGKNGKIIHNIYKIWNEVNGLSKDGYLRYPSELFVNSILKLHASIIVTMEMFVSFMTVIEALLIPSSQAELHYKLSIRGASILSSNPEERTNLLQQLKDLYSIRSKIVHEGHTKNNDIEYGLRQNLLSLTHKIFIRVITIIYMGLNNELPEWVLPDSKDLKSKGKRQDTINQIFDAFVLSPELTSDLDRYLEKHGLILFSM